MEAAVGRRSKYTAVQKAEIVLAVLQRQMTVAEACRTYGVTETTLARWRQLALEGIASALEPRQGEASREVELEREIAELERSLGRMTQIAELRGKALRRLP
jgi:transposase-like protein